MSDLLVLSGKDVSSSVYSGLSERIYALKEKGIIPGLAVVLVGEEPASQVYVRSKTRTFKKLDLFTKTYRLSSDIGQDELLGLIDELNNDNSYHGILVQLPLPKHIESDKVINAISPKKDDSLLVFPPCTIFKFGYFFEIVFFHSFKTTTITW